ncbi:MAG: DUF2382 domain-containing protein [Janthinobacterium lividum]
MTEPQPSTPRADTAEPVSLVRSEERLLVGTQTRAAERVRLRKHVVSEDVTRTVTLRREELVVEHEPVTDDSAGTDRHEASTHEELEIVLHEERAEVRTVVVPVERVRVRVVRVEGERTVTEVLRREQIDVTQQPG